MTTKDEILAVLRALKPELKKRYRVGRIGLFGSHVQGTQSESSDIDILVEFEAPVGFFEFLDLEEFLEARLGGKVDLVSKKALKPRIGARILKELVEA